MPPGLRLTKAERALIRTWLDFSVTIQGRPEAEHRTAQSILDKLELSELAPKKPKSGLPTGAALEAFRGVLGERLVTPPHPGPGWWAQMSRGLSDLGVTAGECATIAKVASAKWKGMIKAESLVRQGAVLLAESQLELPAVNAKRPTEMEDR